MYATYNELMSNGWRMNEIDGMDILAFLKIRAWQIKREKKKKEPKPAYIDTIWKTLTPGRR